MDLWMNLKVFVNKCMNSESVLMIPSSVLSLFLSISFILSLSFLDLTRHLVCESSV